MNTKNNTGGISGLAIDVLLTAIVSSILVWVVGLLGLGLVVDGFGPALVAGIAIALVGGAITRAMMALEIRIKSGLLRAVVNIVLGAVVLICGQLLPGLIVNGFAGALVASVAIGLIAWLLSIIPRRINRVAAQHEQDAGHGA